MLDGKMLYGKWEDFNTAPSLPAADLVDACNGHFGTTPDSPNAEVYHYHVTDLAPLTTGCFGPALDEGGNEVLVTVAMCREHHADVCGDGDDVDVVTLNEAGEVVTVRYDIECPCYDGNNRNTGSVPLPFEAGGVSALPTPSPTSEPTGVSDPTPAPATSATSAPPSSRRNILLFMPDDMQFLWPEGPARVDGRSFTGESVPNMNRVRAEGAYFESAYVAGPKCAPARFNTLTGRYCSRSLFARNHAGSQGSDRTNVEVPQCKIDGADVGMTMQRTLRDNGYATIASGKWHVSPGGSDLWADYAGVVDLVNGTGFTAPAAMYAENMGADVAFTHNQEWLAAEANAQIRAAVGATMPFFVYFTPTMPHGPNAFAALNENDTLTPSGTLANSPVSGFEKSRATIRSEANSFGSAQRANKAGEISCDQALGSLIATMEDVGVLDNTLIIVTLDHGQSAKDSLYEGGTRVAMLARLPGVIVAGSSVAYPTSNLDFAPTFFEMAGVSAAYDLDGTSWWGAVSGVASAELAGRVCIVSEIETDRAVVCPSLGLKYISKTSTVAGDANYPASNASVQLYDLNGDPTEQTNLVDEADHAANLALMAAYIACHQSDTARTGSSACNPEDLMSAAVTSEPTTSEPTTSAPVTSEPTTSEPTTSEPTTSEPTTSEPTSEPTVTPCFDVELTTFVHFGFRLRCINLIPFCNNPAYMPNITVQCPVTCGICADNTASSAPSPPTPPTPPPPVEATTTSPEPAVTTEARATSMPTSVPTVVVVLSTNPPTPSTPTLAPTLAPMDDVVIPSCDFSLQFQTGLGTCEQLRECDIFDSEYTAVPSTSTSNRECGTASFCAQGETETVALTEYADRECQAAPTVAPTTLVDRYSNQAGCAADEVDVDLQSFCASTWTNPDSGSAACDSAEAAAAEIGPNYIHTRCLIVTTLFCNCKALCCNYTNFPSPAPTPIVILSSAPTPAPTVLPSTFPSTSEPSTSATTTSVPTTSAPTTSLAPTPIVILSSAPTPAPTVLPSIFPSTSEPTTSEPTTSEPTTSVPTTSEPTPTPSGEPTQLCPDDLGTSGCSADDCCATEPVGAIIREACPTTCCGIICTDVPSPAPTSDACNLILCSDGCVNECGWSTPNVMCVTGGRTTALEASLGDCSSTDAPTPAPSVAADPCNQHICSNDCSNECGWSTPDVICITGGRTTASEAGLGDCGR